MPPLAPLALRYLAWLIGLRVLYGFLVQTAGLPETMGTGVILAAVPAVDIGMQAVRRATHALVLKDWALIWGMCLSIFAVLQIIVPAIIFAQMRLAMANPATLQTTVVILLSTGAMMALFLWIGTRSAGRRQG